MGNSTVAIKEFRLELSDLTYTGHDLVRPESVLAQPNGMLLTSDGRGGVTRINPDGSQQFLGGLGGNEPNGLAMTDDGSLIVANLGLGKVQKLHPDGYVEDLLTEVMSHPELFWEAVQHPREANARIVCTLGGKRLPRRG
jgi:gluconolactonase